ncbi:MAG: DUF4249 family protein [Bacteroidetes bacterium]|nr:DUF4249 family protein [Bacteroidota bacterium]
MLLRSLLVGLIAVITGCDSADFSVLDNKFVVELTLIANEPLPSARVSELARIDQKNQFKDLAITNAQVLLTTGTTELFMEPSEGNPGIYEYLGKKHIVQPGTRYDLRVTIPGMSEPITGMTNVPSSVKILAASRESGTYLTDEQLTLKVTPGRGIDQVQSNFTLVTQALDAGISSAVPFVAASLEDDDELTLEDFRIGGSPIIAEGNFVTFPDGTIELIYPWIGVNFYGRNIIYLNALDDNLTEFVRSAEEQQGGNGVFGPGVIPNVIQSLSGAHGIFGSVARDSILFTVFPPDDS